MNIDKFIECVRSKEPINEGDLVRVFRKVQDILFTELTVLQLTSPIVVCGDVHGQFYDVLKLFEIGGPLENTKYLFLGDYVDRGYYSIETICLLLAYKVKYPNQIFLLRGNHECRQVNTMYGFYEEVLQRFGHLGPWKLCNEVFDLLPMAAMIDKKTFCCHGGLSPSVKIIDQVALFERRVELPQSGPASDICWSDPDPDIDGWGISARGAGWLFGKRPTDEFCRNNKLRMIARAHQLAMDGYKWNFDKQLVTVWSAPNYNYRSGNLASVMVLNADAEPEFRVFDAVPNEGRVIPEGDAPEYFA